MSKPRGPHTAEASRQGVVREIRAGEVTEQSAATRLQVSLSPIRAWRCSDVHPHWDAGGTWDMVCDARMPR